jgi:hypothetical protein
VLCTATLPATRCTGTLHLKPGAYAVRATYSGDDNFTASTVLGSGALGTFAVLTTVVATSAIPDTGAGLLGWQLLFGGLLVLGGITVAAMGGLRSRRRYAA